MKRSRVLICSAATRTSDGLAANVGDEALTQCLMAMLADLGFEVKSTLNDTLRERALPPARVPVRPLWRLAREIRHSDVVLVGGGTLLQEDQKPRFWEPAAGLLRYVLAVVVCSRLLGRPVYLVAIGAESLDSPRARLISRLICRLATSISTRDMASAELIEGIAKVKVHVSADPAFLTEPVLTVDTESAGAIVVNLQPGAGESLIQALADALNSNDLRRTRIVLLAMDQRADSGDVVPLQLLASRLSSARVSFVSPETPWLELVQILSGAEVAVGMRLHFLILSALAGVPMLPIAASPKTRSLAKDLGLSVASQSMSSSELAHQLETARPARQEDVTRMRHTARRTLRSIAGSVA